MPFWIVASAAVWSFTPARSSSSRTAVDARSPKISSGAASGVTRCNSGAAYIPCARFAVISASSYAGSGHDVPGGTTKARRLT